MLLKANVAKGLANQASKYKEIEEIDSTQQLEESLNEISYSIEEAARDGKTSIWLYITPEEAKILKKNGYKLAWRFQCCLISWD